MRATPEVLPQAAGHGQDHSERVFGPQGIKARSSVVTPSGRAHPTVLEMSNFSKCGIKKHLFGQAHRDVLRAHDVAVMTSVANW